MASSLSPANTPTTHGHFMLGSGTLFLCHMPMFTMEDHMYQLVLRARLPPSVMEGYRALRRENPTRPYNLINLDSDPFTLPSVKTGRTRRFRAKILDGYSDAGGGTPGPVLEPDVPVEIEDVVVYRHFDFAMAHPEPATYYVFGREGEAHLSHFICRETDYQHLLTLPEVPGWLDAESVEAGVTVNVPGLPAVPTPLENPLTEEVYEVRYAGWAEPRFPLRVGRDATVWFSTGNQLNATDPGA